MVGGAYGPLQGSARAYWFGPVATLLTVVLTVRRGLLQRPGNADDGSPRPSPADQTESTHEGAP